MFAFVSAERRKRKLADLHACTSYSAHFSQGSIEQSRKLVFILNQRHMFLDSGDFLCRVTFFLAE